ncbi:protein TASOR 2 [Melozone crissalis]|uniref:protein TASOR 2 n=1 Tax=Melozone crissalis TaxID=40204 RepID=UPI0023DB7B8F|nr:protein TASOR 2 [Melozone crissalis]
MPAPAPPRPAEQNHQEPQSAPAPCPWRGQLCIGGRRLCTIGLRSQHSAGTVPAQLPPSLDIRHVMGLSDLRKKLPEAAFGKKNYTENEVCFQGVHSSLYEVEISHRDQPKMDLLLEKLKEKDLAIIKYLQDQGVLILLTSSALAREDGLEPKEPVSLLALFLFSSPRALSPRVEQQDARPRREGSSRSSLSLRIFANRIKSMIASVLPGLRYALRKAAGSSCSARLQEHLQEYAELQESSQDIPGVPVPSPCQDGDAGPSQEFSERSLAQLRRYLSDPGSFTLGISAALQCLRGAARNVGDDPGNSSSSSSSEPPGAAPCTRSAGATRDQRELPTPAPERSPKSVTSPTKPWGRELRRKSSRILGKNIPAPEAQTPPREAAKKKPSGASPGPKKSGSPGNPKEPMLKLANLQLPHGRKRGAEVLAAEIVHKPQCESAEEEKESSAPNGPAVEAKRPKTLENLDTKKVPGTESGTTKPGKSKTQKNVENRAAKPQEKQQEGSERKEQPSELPGEAASQAPGAEIPGNVHPMAIPSAAFALPGDSSDSHALNLLADLALGSCIPALIPKDSGGAPAERGDSSERQSPPDPKSLRAASDHKYHRADRQGRKPACSRVCQSQALPEPADPGPLASPPGEKPSGIVGRSSAGFQALPPRPAPPACEPNSHSIISAEHSYASPMPEDPRAPPDPKGNHPRSSPAAPLVGKVLPFRHQQSGAAEPARGQSCPRRKEEFSRSHTVTLCGSSMKVTCRWEQEYLFHLDSRYTNDSLEKTVIRALHGPWDPDLPDDVEGMKLILHMWVALFYRKPSKLLSSSRKVVEHSNPSKFVSISSSGGFLELSDDSQDCFGFETCPADSGWDPDQTPSSSLDPSPPCQGAPQPQRSPAGSRPDAAGAVDSTVSSSSGELPCGDEEEEEQEPSSTSCPESLSLQEEHSGETLGVEPGEGTRDVSGVTASVTSAEEPAKEELPGARISPSPPEELGCPSRSPDAPGTENPGSQTPNSSTAPWTEPPSAPQENGEQEKQQEKQQEAAPGSGPGPPEDEEGAGGSGPSLEGGDGADPQPARDSLPLEAAPGSAEPGGAPEEGEECQEPSEHSEKEERKEEEEEMKENEELEDEGSFTDPVGLVLSESSDAEMECEHNPGNSASPEQFGVPEQDPVPSPTSLAPPCPGRSSPAPSGGAGAVPAGFPEEVPPNQEQLPDPWGAPGTPGSEPDGAGVAEVGSPPSESSRELAVPPEPSPVRGAQPDSVTDSPGPAGATPGNGSERSDRDPAPSGEPWEPARSPGSPCRPGVSLALSPDTSSVCPASPSASMDPWGAPEDQPVGSLQSPSQSDLGPRGGGDPDPSPDSLGAEESNQGGNGVLEEEQLGSPSGNGMDELDDPVGAGDGRDSPFGCTDIGDECRAEESGDVFPGTENSPGNDTTNTEMEEIPPHHHLLEPEPSSSIREGVSAIQELPRQQQSFPNIQGDSAPAAPAAGVPAVPSRRESVLCRLWKPGREGGAVQVSVAAWSLHGSFHPSCSQELLESPAPCSPVAASAEPGSAPPSPCDPWDDPEPGSPLPEALPGMLPPTPDSARSCGSPGGPRSPAGDAGGSPGEEEPFVPEELEGGSVASPAPFPARECPLCQPWDECEHHPEGSQGFPDPDCAGTEVGQGEIPASPIPWDEPRDPFGEPPEFSDAEDILDVLPGEEQLPSQDTHEGLAFEDPLENSFGDSDQEYLEGNSRSPLPSRSSCIVRPVDAAGARTTWDSSSRSSEQAEEPGERWHWGIPRDSGGLVVTRQRQERVAHFQLPRRRSRRARESHLARSLLGTWRGLQEITQHTLDMECLRFHYKLREILRNGKPPFSTSRSLFPTAFPPRAPLSPRSRSPLRVTIPPSDGRPRSRRDPGAARRARARSRERGAALRLARLRHRRGPEPEPRGDGAGDVAGVLREFSEFQRLLLAGSAAPGQGEPGGARPGPARPRGPAELRAMVAELCGALRCHLRRVAAGRQPGMFYLLETGQEPFFTRAKALLEAQGFVGTEPLSFCSARRGHGERLLVIVRNQDIASHIHTVPCLLELKRCPSVVFAGVDEPEEVTGDTFQELFQAGGFVVSDEELLERVTLGQLKEVVKLLEKLNRSGRWRWLLHHRESKQLRGDLRVDGSARRKQQLLRWCQGAELLELLPFHGCDSAAEPRRAQCLLGLQAQHIRARFAVFLTENPSSSCREMLESKGILVADISTFLGTVQKVAAPFRRSYW